MKIEVDVGGALKKTAALKAMPKARRHIVHQWAADTVMMLKRRASSMKKSGEGRKTSHMMRNIGLVEHRSGETQTIAIGTGVGGMKEVKYARIQDEGGTITPKGHPYLAIPLKGVKLRPREYPDAFVITSKKGNVLLVQQKYGKVRGGENSARQGLEPLFLLKPEVTLPATRWFSGITGPRLNDLDEMMKTEYVMKVAAGMGGVG